LCSRERPHLTKNLAGPIERDAVRIARNTRKNPYPIGIFRFYRALTLSFRPPATHAVPCDRTWARRPSLPGSRSSWASRSGFV